MIKFKGYCKDVQNLPVSILPDNAVQFREANNSSELNRYASLCSLPALFLIIFLVLLKRRMTTVDIPFVNREVLGILLSLLFIFPHEFLHAMCFPKGEEVSIYFTKSSFFCHSLAVVSKKRFIVMSLLPSLVLGIIPLTVWFLSPAIGKGWEILYTFSVINLISCAGDFYNVYNALRQMPSGTYQQLSGFHSYWFYPQK